MKSKIIENPDKIMGITISENVDNDDNGFRIKRSYSVSCNDHGHSFDICIEVTMGNKISFQFFNDIIIPTISSQAKKMERGGVI